MDVATSPAPVALVTGAARRIGHAIARRLHEEGYRLVLHCRSSHDAARELAAVLEGKRPRSAAVVRADLGREEEVGQLCAATEAAFGRVDLVVNNASSFYPTSVGEVTHRQWDELFDSNARASFFVVQGLLPALRKTRGCVVNLLDIHAYRAHGGHAVYCAAKAAALMLTRALAVDLAPQVRVNGVAPGAILPPEEAGISEREWRAQMLSEVPLKRSGTAEEIAQAVFFLASARYVTGQVIAVDGGKMLR